MFKTSLIALPLKALLFIQPIQHSKSPSAKARSSAWKVQAKSKAFPKSPK
jgi:hypothetical protein